MDEMLLGKWEEVDEDGQSEVKRSLVRKYFGGAEKR